METEAVRKRLFRKVALERLSSPEQLDQLVEVVTVKGWLMLAPLVALIALAVAWGFLGSIPTKVAGKSMLIQTGGLADVTSGSPGRVTEIKVRVGDRVTTGQIVAALAQPELLDRIRSAEGRLAELQGQERALAAQIGQGERLSRTQAEQQRAAYAAQGRAAEERAQVLAQRAAAQRQLVEQGLATRQTLLATQNDLAAARLEAENLKVQAQQLDVRIAGEGRRDATEVANLRAQIGEAERARSSLRATLAEQSAVTSPYAGRVVEVKTVPGALVAQGVPILTVEPSDGKPGELEAVIFILATDGKLVAQDMEVQVVPSTVRREEFGFMRGRVRYVSDYAATTESMQALLQNARVVRDLAGEAPVLEVRARLEPAATKSGFRWSSEEGPPYAVRSGTPGTAEIIVHTQRPASLVIPLLRKSLGLD